MTIPRSFRKRYVPGWDEACQELADNHEKAETIEKKQDTATNLLNHLTQNGELHGYLQSKTRNRHVGKPGLPLIDCRVEKNVSSNPNKVNPNAVSSCLLKNGKFKNPNNAFTRLTKT